MHGAVLWPCTDDDFRYMKLYKLTKTDEFSSVFSFRKRVYGHWLIANLKPNTHTVHRFGLVVPKKVVKLAVKRNYIKRVLRQCLQQSRTPAIGCDIIFQVKTAFYRQHYAQVMQELDSLMTKIERVSQQLSRL